MGRTGRCGKTGVATTFINKSCSKRAVSCRKRFLLCALFANEGESTLIDLKHLLVEAKQRIPPVLAALKSQNDEYLDLGGKGRSLFTLRPPMCATMICMFQTNAAVPTAVVLAIASPTVPSSKRCKRNRRRTLRDANIWRIRRQTGK